VQNFEVIFNKLNISRTGALSDKFTEIKNESMTLMILRIW
jgi:hypothetical protein